MTETARNNAGTTRGRPFQLGNPGRPKGARHRTTLAMQALLEGEGEALTRKACAEKKVSTEFSQELEVGV